VAINLHASPDWPYQVNAGGVVYKVENDQRVYAILIRRGYKFDADTETYNLTKGRVDGDENLEQAALREVKEESGITAKPIAYLGAIQRSFTIHITIDRATHYYLMEYIDRDADAMDDEHDEVVWLPADEAIQKLSKQPKQEEDIIARAEEWFGSGQQKTMNGPSGLISLHADPNNPFHVSAGGLVFRENGGIKEAILLRKHEIEGPEFHLPKGTVENGENLEQTATREVSEETATSSKPLAYLGAQEDRVLSLKKFPMIKSTHYYLFEWQNDLDKPIDPEHDEALWFTFKEAKERLDGPMKQQRKIIERAEEWFGKFGDA